MKGKLIYQCWFIKTYTRLLPSSLFWEVCLMIAFFSQRYWVFVRMDWPKSTRSPLIQLFVLKDCLGMYAIPLCDTVHYNNGAQDTGKIYFIRKNWTRQLTKQYNSRKQKAAEKGQDFCKMQIAMPSIMAIKRKHRKKQSYIL